MNSVDTAIAVSFVLPHDQLVSTEIQDRNRNAVSALHAAKAAPSVLRSKTLKWAGCA